jgi:protein-tyrosine kinase
MTDKKTPVDLVSRAAARISLDKPETTESQAAGGPTTAPISTPAPPTPPPKAVVTEQPLEKPKPQNIGTFGPAIEIDFVKFQKAGLLTPQAQGSRIAEEFRLIKRPLVRVAQKGRETANSLGHVIMVTSTHPGDGKTFTSVNLAMSLAYEHDLFVLAIDADINRRGLSRQFGVEDRPGIMDILLHRDVSIADAIVRTNIPNFAIIPAGKAVEGATELFASQRMTKLVSDVATRYKDRIIVFDTPPVLAASEPGVLAAHVGQIVFVVNSGETSKRSIGAALRLIGVCPDIHFVINRIMESNTGDRFGNYAY